MLHFKLLSVALLGIPCREQVEAIEESEEIVRETISLDEGPQGGER